MPLISLYPRQISPVVWFAYYQRETYLFGLKAIHWLWVMARAASTLKVSCSPAGSGSCNLLGESSVTRRSSQDVHDVTPSSNCPRKERTLHNCLYVGYKDVNYLPLQIHTRLHGIT